MMNAEMHVMSISCAMHIIVMSFVQYNISPLYKCACAS